MKSFKDNQGQQWNLVLTLGKVRTLREKLGLDLLNPQHYLQILDSLTDRLAFVFLLVEPQATELGVDVDEFETRLYGDGVAMEASRAFLKETEFFFLNLGLKTLAKVSANTVKIQDEGQAKSLEIESSGQLDSELERMATETSNLMEQIAGGGLPNSQHSQDVPLGS